MADPINYWAAMLRLIDALEDLPTFHPCAVALDELHDKLANRSEPEPLGAADLDFGDFDFKVVDAAARRLNAPFKQGGKPGRTSPVRDVLRAMVVYALSEGKKSGPDIERWLRVRSETEEGHWTGPDGFRVWIAEGKNKSGKKVDKIYVGKPGQELAHQRAMSIIGKILCEK